MATATTDGSSVIKPDHEAGRKHFIFSQEHEDLRESMQAWVQKELWPHRNEWEDTYWPTEAMKRAGELGFLGLCFPEEYGGQGGDYFYSLVRAECMSYSGSGGTNMGFAVQTDMVLPPIHLLGTEEQKQRYLEPGLKGEKVGCAGDHRAGRRLRCRRNPHHRDPRRRRVRDQRLEDLHHQRPARRLHRPRLQDRPGRAPCRDHALRRRPARRGRRERPRLQRLRRAGEDGDARLRHRRAGLRRRPRPGRCGAGRGGQRLLPHRLGAPGRAAGRRRRLPRRCRADDREDARVRQGA